MSWQDKISHHAQLGGIETAVLDNGPGRGTRIAWINTGTGLRYKVVIDRAMDIADAFYQQYSLAWLSHTGITFPDHAADKGLDWLRTFGGGLMTTCGLTHVGGPETDEYGERGLHGPVSNTSAEIISIIQPDPLGGNMEMSITGIIRQVSVLGVKLLLKRTIAGTLGEPMIRVHDEVINKGNTIAPHMLLYHFNFGWPLVDEGADICWKGSWLSREGNADQLFRPGHDYKKCMAPLESHAGSGEEAAVIDIDAGPDGWCTCGVHNAALPLALSLRFKKSQLPVLTNWQHWGKGEYVTGLEPGTHAPVGQARARRDGSLLFLQPGESRQYELLITVMHTREKIHQFLTDLQ
ncbi:aldose 1-epimerase family protein [Chitinophaga vietnamensis]|uniref:aldose 1-epimerase family protein n=1 Tax=Chitinophaga vietnamensis TaxID=2593957 RepID=UPI0011788C9E|nr:aldose 1-epimerase family protein [Chitinophaga vietnamensis]